jgi:hypothetical protein
MVPVDRPDEDDAPADSRGTALADRVGPPDAAQQGVSAETRDRATYYAELRAAVAAERWQATVAVFKEGWNDHERRWREERAPDTADTRSGHDAEREDGGWRGDGGRALDFAANTEVDHACDRIRDVEQRVITPAMLDIAAEDPSRELVGLDHRLKGPDRLKEKVAVQLESRPGLTTEQALSAVPDAVRFTFCYSDEHYADGVHTDLERLLERGLEPAKPLKNSWESEQYKGINTQWREPETGQRFEVQFHTQVSFAAKQLTHAAYERIRNTATTDDERGQLEDLQQEVCARIPIPTGAAEIEEYPRKERYG